MSRPRPPIGEAEWRAGRQHINRAPGALARTAAELYGADVRLGLTPLIAPAGWIPRSPLPLAEIELEWVDQAADPFVTGVSPRRGVSCRFRRPDGGIRNTRPRLRTSWRRYR